MARRTREHLALAELQPGRDRLPGHRQAADQRTRARQAAGAARPAGQAADRPLRLSQPRAQPRRRRRNPLEAPRRRRLRHRHGEPRPGGLRGRGARGRIPRLRLLSALGLHPCRSWARAAVGRAVPGPGDCLRGGDAARARGAGRQPHHAGRRRRWRGDARRSRGRGRAERPAATVADFCTVVLKQVWTLDLQAHAYFDFFALGFIGVSIRWFRSRPALAAVSMYSRRICHCSVSRRRGVIQSVPGPDRGRFGLNAPPA